MTWTWHKTPAGRLAVIAPSGRVLAEVWPHVSFLDGRPLGRQARARVPGGVEYLPDEPAALAWAEAELTRLAADLLAAGGGR